MDHKEYGQTYLEFVNGCYVPIEKNKNTIYIAPLIFNINPSFDQGFITGIVLLSQKYFYNMKIKLLNLSLQLSGIEYREYEDGKYQINANYLLEKLFYLQPKDSYCLICLTDIDLYNDYRIIKPRDYIYVRPPYLNDFCYELNSFKYRIGLISLCRFDPLYDISVEPTPEDKTNRMKLYFYLLKRIAKTVFKNISHMFGLRNCIFFSCIMNGFNTLEEFDKRPMELCPVCLRKVFTVINRKDEKLDEGRIKSGLEILERMKILVQTLEEDFAEIFDDEVKWYKERIESINKVLVI